MTGVWPCQVTWKDILRLHDAIQATRVGVTLYTIHAHTSDGLDHEIDGGVREDHAVWVAQFLEYTCGIPAWVVAAEVAA